MLPGDKINEIKGALQNGHGALVVQIGAQVIRILLIGLAVLVSYQFKQGIESPIQDLSGRVRELEQAITRHNATEEQRERDVERRLGTIESSLVRQWQVLNNTERGLKNGRR